MSFKKFLSIYLTAWILIFISCIILIENKIIASEFISLPVILILPLYIIISIYNSEEK